jgi:glycosyltransferase involved in cell wall biosynthesis
VLAYHFPPVGGAGVQRTVKFLRYLPKFDWQATVVAGPLDSSGDAFLRDESFVAELPPDTEILRVEGPEPRSASRWRRRGERWLRLRSDWSRWWVDGAVKAATGVSAADLVFTSMSPFQSTAAAARIARELAVPWVADLRDPWALDEMIVYPTGFHRRLELRAMGGALASAATVVMNTPEAALAVRNAFPALSGNVTSIPNGYDGADFNGDVEVRTDGKFRIVHVGSLHTAQGREHRRSRSVRRRMGGMLGNVDILTRSHVFLLEALEQLVSRRPELSGVIELHLAGELTASDRDAIRSDLVHSHGYLDHAASLDLLRSADLLFLPMHDLAPGRRSRIVPGKTYEYLASGRPILAAVPDGDARDLLQQAGNAILCRPGDVAGMAAAIVAQLDGARASLDTPTPEIVLPFERRLLTARLAKVFDEALASRGAEAAGSTLSGVAA